MNSGLTEFVEEIQTKCRRPLQVKSSKTQIHAKFHKILTIRFEDQKNNLFFRFVNISSTIFALEAEETAKEVLQPRKGSPIFEHHLVVLLLIVHLLLGFRRLREIDYYRDDPLVLRLLEVI